MMIDRPIKCDGRVRRELDEFFGSRGPDSLMLCSLPTGIYIVEPPFPDVGCEQYAIGTNGLRHSIAALYPRLDSLSAGDIVLYWEEERGTVHVGRLQEDGFVISKWGNSGPVLKHPIDMVPSAYGEYVFFRRISEEEFQGMRGKSILDMIG